MASTSSGTKVTCVGFISKIKNKEVNYYGNTDKWMYEALEKYPVKGKDVCIMGSTYPWYEAMIIEYGAKSCTVIEYSKRESFHEKITYLQPHEITNQKFDMCLSISSYEHDGLGRYGDPINPNGDIETNLKPSPPKTIITLHFLDNKQEGHHHCNVIIHLQRKCQQHNNKCRLN